MGSDSVVLNEVGDPDGQHPRLPGTCTSQDEEGTFEMLDGFELLGIELLEVGVGPVGSLDVFRHVRRRSRS
jgi:hypothetical protein